jgi:hypothetical protein
VKLVPGHQAIVPYVDAFNATLLVETDIYFRFTFYLDVKKGLLNDLRQLLGFTRFPPLPVSFKIFIGTFQGTGYKRFHARHYRVGAGKNLPYDILNKSQIVKFTIETNECLECLAG